MRERFEPLFAHTFMSGRANVSVGGTSIDAHDARPRRQARLTWAPHISGHREHDRVASVADMVTLEDAAALAGMAPSRLRRWATQKRPRAMAFQHSNPCLAAAKLAVRFEGISCRSVPGERAARQCVCDAGLDGDPLGRLGRIDTPSCP